jgi:hypothetical protein
MTAAIIVTLILLEAVYIFISLKAIIREKLSVTRNAFLFFGIIAANLGSGLIGFAISFSPFEHLIFIALLFGLMKLACKEGVLFYAVGLISVILGVKFTLEIIGMLPVMLGAMEFSAPYRLTYSVVLFIFAVCTRNVLSKLRDIVDDYWKRENPFYVRYLLNIGFIIAICAYIYGFVFFVRNIY